MSIPELMNCIACHSLLRWVKDVPKSPYQFVAVCDCRLIYFVDHDDSNCVTYVDYDAYNNGTLFGTSGNRSGSGDQVFLQRMINKRLQHVREGD